MANKYLNDTGVGLLWGKIKALVPTKLADLSGDTKHRVVTDTEKSTWNGKQNAITGAITPYLSGDATADRVIVSDSTGKLTVSATTASNMYSTINHVNNDIATGYSLLTLTDSNVSSGSYIYKQFVIPESGLYYVHLIARWAGNTTGYRSITLTDSSSSESLSDNSVYTFHKDELPPTNNAFISHSSGLLRVTSNNKYFWIRAFQNSGSTLTTNFRVQFVKLTDSTSVIS